MRTIKKADSFVQSSKFPLAVGAGGSLLTAALLGASHGHDRRAAENYLEWEGVPRDSEKFKEEMKKWRKDQLYKAVMLTLLGGTLSASTATGYQITHNGIKK